MALILASGVGYSVHLRNQVRSLTEDKAALTEALSRSEAQVTFLNKLSDANAAAAKTKQDQLDALEAKEAKGRARTEKAIQDNPDWANTPVPQSILDSLRDD